MQKKKWTKEEDILLIKFYPKMGTDIVSKLPGRTVNAIKNRAQYLGILTRPEIIAWTEKELDILKKYYPLEGKKVISRLPGRTIKTIQVMAFRLNISKKKKSEVMQND